MTKKTAEVEPEAIETADDLDKRLDWVDRFVGETRAEAVPAEDVKSLSSYLQLGSGVEGVRLAIPGFSGAWVVLAAPSYSANNLKRLAKRWRIRNHVKKDAPIPAEDFQALQLASFFGRENSLRDWHLPGDDGTPVPYSEEVYEQLIALVPFRAFLLKNLQELENNMVEENRTTRGN